MWYRLVLVFVLFLDGMTFVVPRMAFAQTSNNSIMVPAGKQTVIECTGCGEIHITFLRDKPAVVRAPIIRPLFKLDVGLNGGVIGAGSRAAVPMATFGLGLEYRISYWFGILGMAEFGGSGGLLEGKTNSIWSTGLAAAFWPAEDIRLAVGAGYLGVRNTSWNFSFGGPVVIAKADFMVWDGLAIGATLAAGPGWDWRGDIASLWSVSAGVRWFFGGSRE